MTQNPCDCPPPIENPSPVSFASRLRPLNLTTAARRLWRRYGFSTRHPHDRDGAKNEFSHPDRDELVDISIPDTIDYPPLREVQPRRVRR